MSRIRETRIIYAYKRLLKASDQNLFRLFFPFRYRCRRIGVQHNSLVLVGLELAEVECKPRCAVPFDGVESETDWAVCPGIAACNGKIKPFVVPVNDALTPEFDALLQHECLAEFVHCTGRTGI